MIRHATGYRLTEFGNELLPLARQVEEAVGSLERHLIAANDAPTGSVRVTCSESIGYRLMQSPLLEIFHKRHPGLRVELIMSDHFLDIAKGEADVAIRAGVPNEETLVGRKIADVPWALYCSRGYLERHGRVERAKTSIVTPSSSSMAISGITTPPNGFDRLRLAQRSSREAIPCRG